jgi:hypothetical protein
MDSTGSGKGTVTCFCKQLNEPQGGTKGGEFIH